MATRTQSVPQLQKLRVVDAMHPGVIACPFETSLQTVARMMATYRVHALVVLAHEGDEIPGGTFWGVVSDIDLLQASRCPDFDEQTAHEVAATPALTVASGESLDRAVQMMVEHELSHLIVVERRSGRPIGVLSTLDVARALARLD
jgi:signal-transduction protein with cAMP-binding, CBS, and nucleotidyltransferase domain